MAVEIVMPRLTDSMEEGTVVRWLVAPGDRVERGQPIAEIETDKATMTYESDSSGVVLELLAEEGETLPLGAVIARLGGPGDAPVHAAPPRGDGAEATAPEAAAPQASALEASAQRASAPEASASGTTAPEAAVSEPTAPEAPDAARDGQERPDGRLRASPLARRLARELGIDLATVKGSGPGGRIVRADVEAAAGAAATSTVGEAAAVASGAATGADESAAPTPEDAAVAAGTEVADRAGAANEAAAVATSPPLTPAADIEPTATPPRPEGARGASTFEELDRTQQTIARRMAESKATVPDFALERTVDMEACRELRERLRGRINPLPTFNDLVVKACALALRDHPRVNGSYRDGRFELHERINVGIAVARPNALLVPTVFDADRKPLAAIARETRRLVERVRTGEITPPELAGGTFTVSNLGMFGVDRFTAIVNPPQAAILTVGAVAPRPAVAADGSLCVRHSVVLTLVLDHRIVYGADGAQFLARVAELLEEPLAMLAAA